MNPEEELIPGERFYYHRTYWKRGFPYTAYCVVEIAEAEKTYVYRKQNHRAGPQYASNHYCYVVITNCDHKYMVGQLLHIPKKRLIAIPAIPIKNYEGTLPSI